MPAEKSTIDTIVALVNEVVPLDDAKSKVLRRKLQEAALGLGDSVVEEKLGRWLDNPRLLLDRPHEETADTFDDFPAPDDGGMTTPEAVVDATMAAAAAAAGRRPADPDVIRRSLVERQARHLEDLKAGSKPPRH